MKVLSGDIKKKILITGGTGKLGKELVKVFPDSFRPIHKKLDITDQNAVFTYIKENRPDNIIHCAALTSIRQCEGNRELAWKVNVGGTENLVKACLKYKRNCGFIYISTACVFHGDEGWYSETDIPYPKNFYALTKLLGEFVVKYSGLPNWLIVRTNFVARDKWPYPRAFTDRYGTYLFAEDVAHVIYSVVKRRIQGTVHICGEEKLSMFDLAKLTTPDIRPMTLTDYQGPPLTIDMSLRSIRIKPFKIGKE